MLGNEYGYTDRENYEEIADAIRSATGETDTMTPGEMAEKIGNIQSWKAVNNGTLAGNLVVDVARVRPYMFYSTSDFLQHFSSVEFTDAVELIGASAFSFDTIPGIIHTGLTSVKFPEKAGALKIDAQGFSRNDLLHSDPNDDTLVMHFLPSNQYYHDIGRQAFEYCGMVNIDLKNINQPSNNGNFYRVFGNCANLETVKIVNFRPTQLYTDQFQETFYQCPKLRKVWIEFGQPFVPPQQTTPLRLYRLTASYPSDFEELVLLFPEQDPNVSGSVTMLPNTFGVGTAYDILNTLPATAKVYVNDNLVNDIKLLQGWSTYASQIFPISDRPSD